jgi:hypothetical protein
MKVNTTLAGISSPLVTSVTPVERRARRLFPFAFSAFVVVFGWVSLKEMRERGINRRIGAIFRYALLSIFAGVMGGYMASYAIGWIIS